MYYDTNRTLLSMRVRQVTYSFEKNAYGVAARGITQCHAKGPPEFPRAALLIRRLAILRGVRRLGGQTLGRIT
jgi:hypothetical protein